MKNFMNKLARNEKGATAIEYGLIAALIAVAAIGGMTSVGEQVKGTFETAGSTIQNAGQ